MSAWTRVKDPLKWLSVACAIAVTATAEYDLAVAVGMHEAVAVAVPGALDAYVVRALQRNREVLTSVLAMVGVNAASHLQAAGILELDWRLITAVSAIAPLVLWRVHSLTDPGTWRRRKLWNVPKASTPVLEEAREQAQPEHTEDLDVPDFMREPLADMQRVLDEAQAPNTLCLWKHAECDGEETCIVYTSTDKHVPEHTPSTYLDTVYLDVPEPSTPGNALLGTVPLPGTGVLAPVLPLPTGYVPEEARDWPGEHVKNGVLEPADTAFLERARTAYDEHGVSTTVRAMKAALGAGTPRAQRLLAAVRIEHTEGAWT